MYAIRSYYGLYNVDIPPEQSYLYETNVYPLGQYKISKQWEEISNIKDTDYTLPAFTKISLQVNAKKTQKIPSKSDKIESIQINDITLQSESEENMINDCIDIINDIDPDFIITKKGDTWDFPYLAHRAEINKIADKIVLGREKNHVITSYSIHYTKLYDISGSQMAEKEPINTSKTLAFSLSTKPCQ